MPPLLAEHMRFRRMAQRHSAANRQNEPDITQVIGKLTHLGWIRTRCRA